MVSDTDCPSLLLLRKRAKSLKIADPLEILSIFGAFMYAVINTGGKQYKVIEGQTLKVAKLAAEIGDKVEFPVLMIARDKNIEVGGAHLSNRKVKAEVVGHGRGEKVKIVKMRRRKHSRKQMGHRQDFTEVKVTAVG